MKFRCKGSKNLVVGFKWSFNTNKQNPIWNIQVIRELSRQQ